MTTTRYIVSEDAYSYQNKYEGGTLREARKLARELQASSTIPAVITITKVVEKRTLLSKLVS